MRSLGHLFSRFPAPNRHLQCGGLVFPDEVCGFSANSSGVVCLSPQQLPGPRLLTGMAAATLPLLPAGHLCVQLPVFSGTCSWMVPCGETAPQPALYDRLARALRQLSLCCPVLAQWC